MPHRGGNQIDQPFLLFFGCNRAIGFLQLVLSGLKIGDEPLGKWIGIHILGARHLLHKLSLGMIQFGSQFGAIDANPIQQNFSRLAAHITVEGPNALKSTRLIHRQQSWGFGSHHGQILALMANQAG